MVALLPLILLSTPAAGAEDLPRYDLRVGRVLSYSYESEAKKEDGTAANGTRSDTRATVLAANADGSRRVVVRSAHRFGEQPEEVNVAMFDVFPDGRATPVGRWTPDVSVTAVFPPLPPDAAAAKGSWKGPREWNGTVITYTAAPSQAGDEFAFTAVGDGPITRVYAVTHKHTNRFDRRKGVIVAGESELTQGYGNKKTSRGTNKLVKEETIDAARAARMAEEYAKLFEADAACVALLTRINDEPGEAEKLAARSKEVLAAAAKDVKDPEVAAEFQRRIKLHAENGGYDVEDAKRRLALIGKPLEDWQAADLDGKKWSREGLKGKVVVMDFWYRGCGWCMFAMPQLKEIAANYKGRDVVVLGMNTDTKEEGLPASQGPVPILERRHLFLHPLCRLDKPHRARRD
jgi:thiol-disulfide isomerase/thioredoxin